MAYVETVVDEEFIKQMKLLETPSSKDLFEASSLNHIVFCKSMLGFPLRAWQKRASEVLMDIVNEKDPVKQRTLKKKLVLLTSRQIGKSEWLAAAAIWLAVFNKYPGRLEDNPGKCTLIAMISITDEQARKLLKRTRKMLRRGDRFMARRYTENGVPRFGSAWFSDLLDKDEANNTSTMTFQPYNPKVHGDYVLKGSESGSFISCLPPTGKALGETYSIIFIDEAGRGDYMSDDFHNDDLYPVGDALDAIRVYMSTPWQSSGFFYQLVNPDNTFADDPEATILCFTIDAVRIEAPERYATQMVEIERRRENGENDSVDRAYYCRFVRGEKSYFEPSTVFGVFDDYEMYSSYPQKCDLGIDFGGQRLSHTVITISSLNEKTKVAHRLYHRRYPVREDGSIIEDIEELMTKFNIQRIIYDDCPAAQYIVPTMTLKGWNLHPMNYRSEKVKKYGAFRASLKKGLLKSYKDNLLQKEMLGLQFGNNSQNSVISPAPGVTDDLIDSFVMSCYFFVQEEGNRIRFINIGALVDAEEK